jgi:hypothetical protein
MASKDTPKCILLRGNPICKEAKSSGALTPGHLVTLNSSGLLVVHPTEGGVASPSFVREAAYIGKTIDDVFASGDTVPYMVCRTGDEVFAILEDGHNVAIGALLESKGDGTLGLIGTAGTPVAKALQAVTTVGGSVATARIKVEVL